MKQCSLCKQTKSTEAFYRRKSGEIEARCKDCFRAIVNRRAKEHREVVRASNRIAGAKFRDTHREAERERVLRVYYADKTSWAARVRRWAVNNSDKRAASEAGRRFAKHKAMPMWANHTAIADLYEQARRLSIDTGIQHHVDHIVPLKNDRVTGLHWEGNLAVIPATDNLSKGNRFWPDDHFS